jgi:hypothetical protein
VFLSRGESALDSEETKSLAERTNYMGQVRTNYVGSRIHARLTLYWPFLTGRRFQRGPRGADPASECGWFFTGGGFAVLYGMP